MNLVFSRRPLEELASSVDYGLTAPANPANVGPRFLRITDIQDDSVDWATVPFCEATAAEEEGARLESGDIVFARTGATTGKSYLLRRCPERAVFASYLIRVRPNRALVEPRYLSWFFQTPDYWRQITSSASGTAQPGVNATKLKALQVPTPQLPKQRRIADVLDKADAIRRKRKEAIALTDKFLRSTFLEMFGDPVANSMGWKISRLGDLAEDLRYGTSEKCGSTETDGSLPVLRIPNVAKGVVDWTDLKYARLSSAENERLAMQPGDILFVRSNGNPELIGRCAVYDSSRRALFASYLIRARIRDGLPLATYLRGVFSSLSYRQVLTSEARTTAGNYNISAEVLRQLRVPVVPHSMVEKYFKIESAIHRQLGAFENARAASDELFGSLVVRAFSGGL